MEMSDCSKFEEMIWEAAEGCSIPEDAREHIDRCDRCSARMEMARSAIDGLAALRQVQAPDPTAAIHRRLDKDKRSMSPRFSFAWAAAVLLLAVSCTAFWLSNRNPGVHEPIRGAAVHTNSRPGRFTALKKSPTRVHILPKRSIILAETPSRPVAKSRRYSRDAKRPILHKASTGRLYASALPIAGDEKPGQTGSNRVVGIIVSQNGASASCKELTTTVRVGRLHLTSVRRETISTLPVDKEAESTERLPLKTVCTSTPSLQSSDAHGGDI